MKSIENTGEVVALNPNPTGFTTNALDFLLSYWERLRGHELTPRRSAVDPRQIKSALNDTFILEVVQNGAPRFRLAGINVCDLRGMELRGMQAQCLFCQNSIARFNTALEDVTTSPSLVHLDLKAITSDATPLLGRMQLMPMRDHNNKLTRILGAVMVDRQYLSPPVSFEITNIRRQRILSKAPIASAYTRGMAEERTSFQRKRAPRPIAGRPHLRVVK